MTAIDQSDWPKDKPAYDWDDETGLSPRPIPGQKGGQYVLTGLAHDKNSKIAYVANINQFSTEKRSRKLEHFRKTMTQPKTFGPDSGDLLVVGWGSTRGAIEEAISDLQAAGKKVSSLHLRFLSPMEPGIKEIFSKFKEVMTVELNYSDEKPYGPDDERRPPQLALLLRAHTRMEIDHWSRVPGTPLAPAVIREALENKLAQATGETNV